MFALSLRICDGAAKEFAFFFFLGGGKWGGALLHICCFAVLTYLVLTYLSMEGWKGGRSFKYYRVSCWICVAKYGRMGLQCGIGDLLGSVSGRASMDFSILFTSSSYGCM